VKKPIRRIFLACVAAGIFFLSSQPSLGILPPLFPHQDKVLHLVEYAVLYWALFLNRDLCPERKRTAILFAVGLLYALSDEIHQGFVTGRDCSAADFAADATGLAAGAAACSGLGKKTKDSPGAPADSA